MKLIHSAIAAASLLACFSTPVQAAPCPFDNTKICTLMRDILNDKTPAGLNYYAATNYDHRISGEINVYDATRVTPYQDNVNAPGQLKLGGNIVNGLWKTGEIMTRVNLDQPPFNSPTKSAPWTTKEIQHGYLEVIAKLPKCDASDDGLCQANTNPVNYNSGLWPAIWMEPTMDANWPQNGEIDIMEAYQSGTNFNVAPATLHFNGNDGRCGNGDCKFVGFHLGTATTGGVIFNNFHTWGFEWQPDPNTAGGIILTGYFDNMKIWGPIATASLPADGPGALSRGFNDPNGGYYLIVNLAIGGPFAGAPNQHMQAASMFVQSIKAYDVGGSGPPPKTCLPPTNIQSMWSADKKQITLSWQEPANSDTVQTYEIHDWQNVLMWKSATKDDHCFMDPSLPGTNGKFTYFLYTNCTSGQSQGVQLDVNIT